MKKMTMAAVLVAAAAMLLGCAGLLGPEYWCQQAPGVYKSCSEGDAAVKAAESGQKLKPDKPAAAPTTGSAKTTPLSDRLLFRFLDMRCPSMEGAFPIEKAELDAELRKHWKDGDLTIEFKSWLQNEITRRGAKHRLTVVIRPPGKGHVMVFVVKAVDEVDVVPRLQLVVGPDGLIACKKLTKWDEALKPQPTQELEGPPKPSTEDGYRQKVM